MLVLVRYFTDNPCRISCGYAVVGNILCHNAPRTDNNAVSDLYSRCDYDVSAYPYVIAYRYIYAVFIACVTGNIMYG